MHETINKLPKRYIGYNFEQIATNNRISSSPQFWSRVKAAEQVWDYSQVNLAVYERNNLKATFVPFGFVEGDVKPQQPSRHIDVLFTGAINERRQAVINNLKVPVSVHQSTFKDELAKLLQSSRVSINMHYYEGGTILESTRIVPLLANGVRVVSERSLDPWYDKLYEPIVHFADVASFSEAVQEELAKTTDNSKEVLEYLRANCSYAKFIAEANLDLKALHS